MDGPMTDHPAHDLPTESCGETLCPGWALIVEVADVTDEILDQAEFYAETEQDSAGRVDWQSLFDDRLEGLHLNPPDNRRLTFGNEYDTPAMRKIQREIRKRLRD